LIEPKLIKPSEAYRQQTMKPMNNSDKAKILIGLGLVSIVSAAHEAIYPTSSSPAGRWGWLFRPIWEGFGSNGLVAYWLVFAAFLIGAGIYNWRKK
jgi:hypothetical protein